MNGILWVTIRGGFLPVWWISKDEDLCSAHGSGAEVFFFLRGFEEIRIKLMKKWLKADEILIYFVSLQHTNGLRLEPRT